MGDEKVGVQDLVMLDDLSEDSINTCLKQRLSQEDIYTFIGEVLVSVNPFKQLRIYEKETIDNYKGKHAFEVPPHIFMLAEDTFRALNMTHYNQSIIISGESGAGKTEAAKLIMKYIAAVCGSSEEIQRVKTQLLKSNPVLEAFGNAQTLRNDNSSRFGKYLEMVFDFAGDPIGGIIRNFLLEKSRLVNPGKKERDFHIFYQLHAGMTKAEIQKFHYLEPSEFNYLKKSGKYRVRSIDDKKWYDETIEGLKFVGIKDGEIDQVKAILSAVMWMGQIEFGQDEQDNAVLKDREPIKIIAELIQVDEEKLATAMVSRTMLMKGANITTFLNCGQAEYTRDSLAKNVYGRLFDWLIERINIATDPMLNAYYDPNYKMTIGVLDIYGFEVFEHNSFEQFCINYANEKLQQIFIEYTLKKEQAEYEQEGIDWVHIDYFNNEVVCDLIEKRPRGILAFLDEECTMPNGSDMNLLGKLYKNFEKHDQFSKPDTKFDDMRTAFIIKHYAGDVSYEVASFMDKNKDLVWIDLVQLGESSTMPLFDELFLKGEASVYGKKRSVTLGGQFKTQVLSLCDALEQTEPHYVRCIKSNDDRQPMAYNDERCLHQIKYLGLYENVRVRRAGYAARIPYTRFLKTYKMLSQDTWPDWNGDEQKGSEYVVSALKWERGQTYELGHTKIFVQKARSVFEIEQKRSKRVAQLITKLQSTYRGYKDRKKFKEAVSAIKIQKTFRGHEGRKYINRIRMAMKIQRAFRKYIGNREYIAQRKKILSMLGDKKQRRRESLIRPFLGDYLNVAKTKPLRDFIGFRRDRSKILFSDHITKISKDDKQQIIIKEETIFIVTDEKLFFITKGHAPRESDKKKGIAILNDKGQMTLRRVLALGDLKGVTVSELADNLLILSVKDILPERPPALGKSKGDKNCKICERKFKLMLRKHHCRVCNSVFCKECSSRTQIVAEYDYPKPQRVCDNCYGTRPCEYKADYVMEATKKTEIAAVLVDSCKDLARNEIDFNIKNKVNFTIKNNLKNTESCGLDFVEKKSNKDIDDGAANVQYIDKTALQAVVNPGLPADFVQKQQDQTLKRKEEAAQRRAALQEDRAAKDDDEKDARKAEKERIIEEHKVKKEAAFRLKQEALERKEEDKQAEYENIRRKRLAALPQMREVAKCKVCACGNFEPHEIRKHKCSNCFHQH